MNIQKLLGATTPVEIAHGELDGVTLKIILHAKLDAVAGAGEAEYRKLEERESEAQRKKLEIHDTTPKLAFVQMAENGVVALSAEEQDAFADYVDTLLAALAEPDTDVAALTETHSATLKGFAERLRIPALTKKQLTELRKHQEKHDAALTALDKEIDRARAERLCYLAARAETQLGDAPPELIEGWGPDGVAEFSADTVVEFFEAVSKKVLARWRNR